MARSGTVDYGWLATRTTLASFVLVVLGFLAATLVTAAPGWEQAVFFDAEVLGTLGIVVCPFLFGIVLPLLE